MKINLKRISKRSLALILGILMLFSTLVVGTITASADTLTGGQIIYLNGGGSSYWNQSNAWFAAYFFGGTSGTQWVKMTQQTGDYYYVEVPSGNWNNVIFTRMDPAKTDVDWTSKWNQTEDLTLSGSNNAYTINGWGDDKSTGSWSTYQPSTDATLSASATSVDTGQNVTLTPGISATTFNDYKSVSYNISPSTGASITDNTFTATTAGTYTVTATVTYNAKGFTNITNTATATQTITVKAAQPTTYTGLSVDKTGKGTVTISADNCTIGGSVNITATPATGYKFTKWTATNGTLGSSTSANTTFKPSANNAKATATFTEKLYTVTVTNGTPASVSAGVDTHPSITAADKTGYKFTGWSTTGGATVADNTANGKTTTVSATAAGTVTANYEEITYAYLYYSNPGKWSDVYAYLWRSSDNAENASWHGEKITLNQEIRNNVTYYFVKFDSSFGYDKVIFNNGNDKQTGDLGFDSSNYGQFSDNNNKDSIDANWQNLPANKVAHDIIVSPTPQNGAVTFYSDSSFSNPITSARQGEMVYCKVAPNTGYKLDTLKYNDGSDHTITLTDGKYSFEMPDSAVTVTATFVEDLSTNWELGGGYTESDWTYTSFKKNPGESAGTVSYVTIKLEANRTYEFKLRENGSTYYGCNTTITGSVENYIFYEGNDNGNCKLQTTVAGDYEFKLDSSTHEVSVTYPTYTATIQAGSNGKVNKTTITGPQTVKATPNSGYLFDKWVVSDSTKVSVADAESAETTITPLANGGVVTATFVKAYSVTVNGASFSSTPADITKVKQGTEVTINLPATAGVTYDVTLPTGVTDTDPANGVIKFTMPAKNITITVSPSYSITVAGTTNGTASVDKYVAKAGDTITVTTEPDDGYELDTISVTGDVTVTDNQFTMPANPVTVTVTFKDLKTNWYLIGDFNSWTASDSNYRFVKEPGNTGYATLAYNFAEVKTIQFKLYDSNAEKYYSISNNSVTTIQEKETRTFNQEGAEGTHVEFTPSDAGDYLFRLKLDTQDITISNILTDTQRAYKKLVADMEQYGQEASYASYYDTNKTEWESYNSCVSAAKVLVDLGLPSQDATNTVDYTTASDNLIAAYNNLANIRKVNTIYILSKFNESDSNNTGYVNIYMFNKPATNTTAEKYTVAEGYTKRYEDTTGINAAGYAMKLAGTVDCNGSTKYLYKFEYYGKADFIVYVGANATDGVAEENKLTANVSGCKGFESYYIDLKDRDKTSYEFDAEDTNTVLNYTPLSVSLDVSRNYCIEGSEYNLKEKVTITESGILKTASEVTVNHTYTYTFNGNTVEIDNPETWVPAEPGVYTITVNSSNGITTEDVTNTFNLYVKDKLDIPLLVCTYGEKTSSESDVLVTIEDDITISISNSYSYPKGTMFRFEVDGSNLTDQTAPTLTYDAGKLSLGKHTFRVKAISPTTKFKGTNIKMYETSNISGYLNVTVEKVKYTLNYDFTGKHVASFTANYISNDNSASTTTPMSGSIRVDVDTTVTFTVVMKDGYEPIPNNNCWSGGTTDVSISSDRKTYTFKATQNTNIVFKSYLPVSITPATQNIRIGTSAEIEIVEKDSNKNTNYQLYYKKATDTNYVEAPSATLTDRKFTTSNLPYGEYQFKVKQSTVDYTAESNVVTVRAVLGTAVIEYFYQEYNIDNGVPYDPYVDNNLKSEATKYTKTLENTDISVILEKGVANTYKEYAPSISSYYFDYVLETDNITGGFTEEDNTVYKITKTNGTITTMTADAKKYKVSINGKQENEFTSYYQQKTFLLDASKYCDTPKGDYGYVWYNVDSNGNRTIVSTDQYYKLRVARDTNIEVEVLDREITTPTTFINEPVYNVITGVDDALRVQMNMLVENYLPEGAVRTRTGVAYCAYTGTQPTIDTGKLSELICTSQSLAESKGSICEIGKLKDNSDNTVTIMGYYTKQDNENGKFIFAPTAKLDSKNTYLVYSYLTYTMNNRSVTIVSANPVTASIALYDAQKNNSSTNS